MQNMKHLVRRLSPAIPTTPARFLSTKFSSPLHQNSPLFPSFSSLFSPSSHHSILPPLHRNTLHTSAICSAKYGLDALQSPKKWPAYNQVRLPPQLPSEPRRAAQCFHYRTQIRHSQYKLWYAAQMIRGLSIDEAIKQLKFNHRKASHEVLAVLLEAQEKALREQNFEFKSKMWIAESFATRGHHVKGLRRHARARYGQVSYNFNHYFVKLEEGDPPEHYYPSTKVTLASGLEDHVYTMRGRRIIGSL